MKGKMLIISILVCVLVFATVSGASAYCSKYAKVVYIYMNGENSSSAKVYVAPLTAFPVFYYYFTTTNPRYIDMLSDALGDNSTIYFTGDVNTCPTSGQYRNVGKLIGLRVYRNT